MRFVGMFTLGVAGIAILGSGGTPADAEMLPERDVEQPLAHLEGPITTGQTIEPLSARPLDLSGYDYTEHEFFASGTATAFRPLSTPSDGKWSIAGATSAFYRTRLLVRRPVNPAHFNGTVVVEWMNVSGGESAPDWDYLNPELMRAGYAYVAVSAQALGVNGGQPILGSVGSSVPGGLVAADPARYGTLEHPGDMYSFDIFSQIGTTLKAAPESVLGGLRPRHVVAAGESQSAFYLTTFVDALQPRTHAFDGFFIHSRGGSGARLDGTAITAGSDREGLRIRTDVRVPVFIFETQTDVIELDYVAARQPNTTRIRTWEVAGTAHVDEYMVGSVASALGCVGAINSGPQHEVVQAAFAAFVNWVERGTPPASPEPFGLTSTSPPVLALDVHGNVIGGVRTPAVDVPIATLSGAPPAGASEICALFGSTTPFSPETLLTLYHNQGAYLALYQAELDRAIASGFILEPDRAALLAKAEQVDFPTS